MAMFNSYVKLPEGIYIYLYLYLYSIYSFIITYMVNCHQLPWSSMNIKSQSYFRDSVKYDRIIWSVCLTKTTMINDPIMITIVISIIFWSVVSTGKNPLVSFSGDDADHKTCRTSTELICNYMLIDMLTYMVIYMFNHWYL